MKNILLFLLAPVFITADISINVIASEDESERQIHVSGSDIAVISDDEINTFKLSDEKLKSAVASYNGKRPDDVYLKSPTPWNDLYKTYQWMQVNRVLKPIRAKMSSIQFKPVIVLTQHFNNTSCSPAIFKAYIRQQVEDTIASIWETNGQLTTGLNISYGIEFLAMAVSGKASFNYFSKWGENIMKSQSVTVGSETGLEITLQPKQRAQAKLFATRGEMKIKIDYEASLEGFLAVNYEDGFKGHHFHGLDVNLVLRAGGFNSSVFSSEEIVIGYYSDSEVMVQDVDKKDILNYS